MNKSMLPKSRQQLILAVLMVCSLLIWLDNTVLSTALETLADPVRGLNASPAELQWATGSYTLAFATLMFTAGALGDRFGHRVVLATGLVVFGIAVGGTIMSIVYRRATEPSLAGVPGPVREQARVSAEQARNVATTSHLPALGHAADDAFVHAMHVGAVWIMFVALFGAAVLRLALC